MMLKCAFIAGVIWTASCAPPSTTPKPAPQTQPAGDQPPPDAPPPAAATVDPEVDALLTRLEQSAADLTSFAAKIVYEKEDALLGRTETRTGEIIYRIDAEKKTFAVLFDKRVIGNRLEERLYHYIFDGRWLAEIDHENKQFIKREVVPPGKTLDPLKLGEGPFPLPIGQAKKDVLARFDVSKIDVPTDGILKSLENVDGLLLVPKPNTPEASDYQRVEIFYDRATSLPVGINAIEENDDRKTVRLTDMRRNPALDEATLKKLDITDPPTPPWDISIQPWKVQP